MKKKLNEFLGADLDTMVKKKKKPIDFEKEYFLITWHEAGDEIHFMLMDVAHYDVVEKSMIHLASGKANYKYREGFLSFCNENQTFLPGERSAYWIQTYCDEEWPFSGYNIARIISIPDFGA